MSATRAPRPTDLVALVTFDDQVRENLAVTRQRLAQPSTAPKPLSAAIEQWLHLGPRIWVSMAGRQIRGIATARELAERCAWEIDTLIDADDDHRDGAVLADLLRQAVIAAQQAEVTHLLLRTAHRRAAEVAMRCGFARVIEERLWSGRLAPPPGGPAPTVREWSAADAFAAFQLYCRATPVAARQSMAMTLDEWNAVRDGHWQEWGDGALVAERSGRVVATARYARGSGQFTLEVEPDATAAADALLAALPTRLGGAHRQIALVAACGGAEEAALRRAGLAPEADCTLLCRRIAPPVREEAYARAGIPIIVG